MTSVTTTTTYRVETFREDDWWVARVAGLDANYTQARTFDEVTRDGSRPHRPRTRYRRSRCRTDRGDRERLALTPGGVTSKPGLGEHHTATSGTCRSPVTAVVIRACLRSVRRLIVRRFLVMRASM